MKRRLNRLLTLLMVMMMTTSVAMAQEEEQHVPLNLKVTITTDEAGTLFVKIQEQIEELGELYDVGELTVNGPLNIDDYNVIRNQLTNLTMLDLGNTTIEDHWNLSLSDLALLQKVVLPQGLTAWDSWAGLTNCVSLTEVVLPPNLTNIGDNCFCGCTKLASINIPQTVTTIGSSAFSGCALTSIDLPSGVKTIGSNAFTSCPLTSINLPNSITSIGGQAFFWCDKLTSISLPDGISEIEIELCKDCSSLAQVKLPSSLTTIKEGAFAGTAITTFTLPAGATIEGKNAFANCDTLQSFYFPDGLKTSKEIGIGTFAGCRQLKEVRLPQDLTEIPYNFFEGTAISELNLPESVTAIRSHAFAGNTGLKDVTIPNTVKVIEMSAFEESSVEQLIWSSSAATVPFSAFANCKKLRSVSLPETVTLIDGMAFMYCESLKNIYLPEGITTIGGSAFNNTPLETVNIPSTVKVIENNAFISNKFTHIDFPDGLTYIGDCAFENVPLAELTLPSQLKVIGSRAFYNGRYSRVVVPEGVVSLGEKPFLCPTVKYIDLPSTILVSNGLILGDSWDAMACDSIIMRAAVPPFCTNYFVYHDWWVDTPSCTVYVPEASMQLYQASSNFNNPHTTLLPIDGYTAPAVLNITGMTTLNNGYPLLEQKVDVNFFDSYLHREELNGICSNDHPRLVNYSNNLNMGTVNMTCDPKDIRGWTQYTWPVFLNKGTATADLIDLKWMTDEILYFTPSFNLYYSDIEPEVAGAPFAIFSYDATARAVGNLDGSWVRLRAGDMLQAGQGYLLMAAKMHDGTYDYFENPNMRYFYIHQRSHQGGNNYFLANSDITLPVTHAAGEFVHNKNWNLLGQPYPAFFDIRGIDYDGPILLHTGGYGGWWEAYSPLDDEVVLTPMQTFFVQVPDGINSISLSADRRQLGNEFVKEEENNSRRALRRADHNAHRIVFNATLSRSSDDSSASEQTVRTRFVLNPEATLRYDIGHDAPAMAVDSIPQFYTLANGVAYAINERPLDDGLIRLGMHLPKAGSYQMSLALKTGTLYSSIAEDVWLVDNETNTRTLLLHADGTPAEPYTFEVAEPTTLSSRFLIAIGNADPTAITDIDEAQPQRMDGLFNLAGQRISAPQRGIYINNGKKVLK